MTLRELGTWHLRQYTYHLKRARSALERGKELQKNKVIGWQVANLCIDSCNFIIGESLPQAQLHYGARMIVENVAIFLERVATGQVVPPAALFQPR